MNKFLATSRGCAVESVVRVFGGESLGAIIPELKVLLDPRDVGLYQALTYGTVRWFSSGQWLIHQLVDKKLRKRDHDIEILIATGLFELIHHQRPEHAVVNDCVALTKHLPRVKQRPWAKGLVNAILRRFLREKPRLLAALAEAEPGIKYSAPEWMVERIFSDWPEQAESVLDHQNRQAPLFLRVNHLFNSDDKYQADLNEREIASELVAGVPGAIRLAEAQNIESLPGYAEGAFAVQDVAAQAASLLLSPKPGERVLDACCAPGGKTAHLWALGQANIELTGLDVSESRLNRTRDNLQRLSVEAKLHCVDAATPDWWDKKDFDAILLDAPCSGLGVVRRHPDIKWLRKDSDITSLVAIQAQLLKQCWSMLAPGGRLLYSTCSILKDENERQIEHFLQSQPTAILENIELSFGRSATFGWQNLPFEGGGDGFYYALLSKGHVMGDEIEIL